MQLDFCEPWLWRRDRNTWRLFYRIRNFAFCLDRGQELSLVDFTTAITYCAF